MGPADCFVRLWQIVEGAIRKRRGAAEPGERQPIFYQGMTDGADDVHYHHNNGRPWIEFRTARQPRADPINEPDRKTQPEIDAIVLAHEYGHFLCRGAGMVDAAFEAALLAFEHRKLHLSREEWLLIWRDEVAAWKHAREELSKLGVTEWEEFETQRAGGLDSYQRIVPPLAFEKGCVVKHPQNGDNRYIVMDINEAGELIKVAPAQALEAVSMWIAMKGWQVTHGAHVGALSGKIGNPIT